MTRGAFVYNNLNNQQKMTMSPNPCHQFLHLRKKSKDDDKLTSYELYKACAHMLFQNYNSDDIVMTSNYPG
jgi:hypothetical protein